MSVLRLLLLTCLAAPAACAQHDPPPAPVLIFPTMPAPPDTAKPIGPARISGGVIAGNILTKVAPVYPAEAKAKGISGTVVMQATIGRDGSIKNLNVVSGPEELRQASLDAVRQWTYKPYLLNDVATEVDTTISINFNKGNGSHPNAIRVGESILPGLILKSERPYYPPEAKANHIQGTVTVHGYISTEGKVEDLHIVSGPSIFQQPALNALQQRVYRPYLVNGVPTEIETEFHINYSLSEHDF